MKVTKVGKRGYVFSFDDPFLLNIYVIEGEKNIFFCDTGLGSETVNDILCYLTEQGIKSKPFIVFNSHADYDHVWGNHVFKDSTILAHELSPDIFLKEGEEILDQYGAHKRGDVILTPPNKLFKDKCVYEEEGIEFYHTPGHTLESSSCYDRKEKALFVGDNIENPCPYINFLNLEDYIATLKEYLKRDAKVIISGHDEVMYDKQLIKTNLDYLEKLRKCALDKSQFSKKQRGIHYLNVTKLGDMLKKIGDTAKAKIYYSEALEILEEMEKTPIIQSKIKGISAILDDFT